jgi:hypothetical protein
MCREPCYTQAGVSRFITRAIGCGLICGASLRPDDLLVLVGDQQTTVAN